MKSISLCLTRRSAVLVLPVLSTLLTGCQTPPSLPDVPGASSEATGIADAIEFTGVAEPLDVEGLLPAALDVETAVRLTLRHDLEVQAKLARVRAALADARQARLLPNPVLSVVFRFPDGGGKPDIDAGLTADLLGILQAPRKASAADRRLQVASAEVLAEVLAKVATAEERLATLQAIDAEEAVLNDRHALVLRLRDLAQARVEAGEATRLDVLTLDAERVEIEAEQVERRGKRDEQRLSLLRLVGRPSATTEFSVTPLALPSIPLPPEPALIELALERRPDVQSARWELAALGDDAALTRWSWLDGAGGGVEAERDGDWAVGPGATVPLPLLDWGQARRAKADAQVIEARHRVTDVARQAVEDVRQARAAFAAASATLTKVRDELLPLALRRHDQAEAQYRAGESDLTTLLQAQQHLLAARSRLIEAQKNILLADIRLRRAVGGSARYAALASATTRPIVPSNTTLPTR
ncbi:MAG: TolC family protein [Tepidisphaeraceae bacterium]